MLKRQVHRVGRRRRPSVRTPLFSLPLAPSSLLTLVLVPSLPASNTCMTMTSFIEISSVHSSYISQCYISSHVLCKPNPIRPENILYRTKDADSDIVIADFGMFVVFLCFSQMAFTSTLITAQNTCTPMTNNCTRWPAVSVMLPQKYSTNKATAKLWICGLSGNATSHVSNRMFFATHYRLGSSHMCYSAVTCRSEQKIPRTTFVKLRKP
jgi:hypothetical protein